MSPPRQITTSLTPGDNKPLHQHRRKRGTPYLKSKSGRNMGLPTFLAKVSVVGSEVGGLLEIFWLRVRLLILGLLDQRLLLRLLLDPVLAAFG
ncbi:hypothetical protein U9M48_030659 [Paspalum notatum var. saurae]|uniref:Uncharacterized protein n=1 Tax=Paspalum notatum var. saurae TaxID=547442 RepID=A0AAQ3X2F7_PASNO